MNGITTASTLSDMMITETTPQSSKDEDKADFGDFVSNEDEEADLEEIAEPWHQYDVKETPHTFYPIFVGEILIGRYLVEHKIGFGGFSTVWMAYDLRDQRDVALKVISLGEWRETEFRIQTRIAQQLRDTSHLVTYRASYLLFTANGDHRVLVLPLMGPCLCPLVLRNMPMATRMSAARQLLEVLAKLHEAGFVNRDLNDRNCMWGLVPLSDCNRNTEYEILNRPLKEPIPFVDLWKRGELVYPLRVPENLRTEEFYLANFGLAMKVDDPIAQPGYPPKPFCSPDRLHGKAPSYACDMWSYMVIFAELYLGFYPFSTYHEGGIISGIVRSLGALPAQWKGLCVAPGALDSWYDPSQKHEPDDALESTIAYYRPDADPGERELVRSILLKVFHYDPEKRPTATELLQDPSFRTIVERYAS